VGGLWSLIIRHLEGEEEEIGVVGDGDEEMVERGEITDIKDRKSFPKMTWVLCNDRLQTKTSN
jgi:hypothetical protein